MVVVNEVWYDEVTAIDIEKYIQYRPSIRFSTGLPESKWYKS